MLLSPHDCLSHGLCVCAQNAERAKYAREHVVGHFGAQGGARPCPLPPAPALRPRASGAGASRHSCGLMVGRGGRPADGCRRAAMPMPHAACAATH